MKSLKTPLLNRSGVVYKLWLKVLSTNIENQQKLNLLGLLVYGKVRGLGLIKKEEQEPLLMEKLILKRTIFL